MLTPTRIVTACWIVFFVVWMTKAATAKRSIRVSGRGMAFRIAFIALVVILNSQPRSRVALSRLHFSPTIAWIGAAICVLGIALAIWARLHLGRNWGMPMSVKADAELVTTGPYATIRHPIYTGVLLGILGSSLAAAPPWLVLFFIAFCYFVLSARTEERRLLAQFPETYGAYRARTKMLFPFLF